MKRVTHNAGRDLSGSFENCDGDEISDKWRHFEDLGDEDSEDDRISGANIEENGDNSEDDVPASTEQAIKEAMQHITLGEDAPVEFRPCDLDEDRKVEEFMRKGCGCRKAGGKPCSGCFEVAHVKEMRLSCQTLEKCELDMFIMGQLSALCNTSNTVSTLNRHKEEERKKSYTSFFHQHKPICRKMFLFFHSISKKRLENISTSLGRNGITPRIHGNAKRLPVNTLTLKNVKHVIHFLQNYAEQNAILLPGRIPGYSRSDVQLLPSSTSKKNIWKTYFEATQRDSEVHSIAYSTFCKFWNLLLPQIILMKPMTDLCWTCQKNSVALMRSANCPEREKSAAVQHAQEHLQIVQCERSNYKTTCDDCEREVKDFFTNDGVFQPPPLSSQAPANSRRIRVHYSFDYTQQVHFPSDPLQPGPIYFLTPRKCSIFGVNCEALPRQVNFLGDEAGDCGKGANAVISQLDYFFRHHGLGETEVFLHADNCYGQNKNNYMIWYLMWRVMTSQHTQITLSFLVVGHTKFAPDWCFGLFKRLYRRTKVGSLQAIAQVVNNSAQCNFAQLMTKEDGTTIVPISDWISFLVPHFKKLESIKKYHHFRFASCEPGIVYTKLYSDTEEERHVLLKNTATSWLPDPAEYPTTIIPKGLSPERQWYLYDYIREFCPVEDRDITCPVPKVPRPGSRGGTLEDNEATDDHDSDVSSSHPRHSSKKSRRCGICRREGHNSRSCPDTDHKH